MSLNMWEISLVGPNFEVTPLITTYSELNLFYLIQIDYLLIYTRIKIYKRLTEVLTFSLNRWDWRLNIFHKGCFYNAGKDCFKIQSPKRIHLYKVSYHVFSHAITLVLFIIFTFFFFFSKY